MKPEPAVTEETSYRKQEEKKKKKTCLLRQRHPNPLDSYAVLPSPSSPPTSLLSDEPRKKWVIFPKNTMMQGVSECLRPYQLAKPPS